MSVAAVSTRAGTKLTGGCIAATEEPGKVAGLFLPLRSQLLAR
ncbi:MAG: hypothetical protein JWL97_909 [Gemmatimonadales bacterium]|nr:hypothetical protein [Gemmatimonadales bacterium]